MSRRRRVAKVLPPPYTIVMCPLCLDVGTPHATCKPKKPSVDDFDW